MAKRSRGSTRPGQRAPLQRSTASRPPARPTAATPGAATSGVPSAPRPTGLTAEEEARAAEIEARIIAEEKAADQASRRGRDRGRVGADEPVRRTGNLAAEAAEEYAYVARDVRRLTIIGGGLIALLIAFWAVVQVTGLGPFD